MDNVMYNLSFEIRLTPVTTFCVLRLGLTIFCPHRHIRDLYTPGLNTEIWESVCNFPEAMYIHARNISVD
jgi:hypothetical protein